MRRKPKIMVLETSGRLGSVAVAEGGQLLAERFFSGELQHTTELLPTMDELCRAHGWQPGDVEQLYVSAGPGSFTGLRIAITAAKAMAFAQDTRIVAVPSTEALVLNAAAGAGEIESGQVAVVIEAGRGRVFAAIFEAMGIGGEENEAAEQSYMPGYRTVRAAASMLPAELLEQTSRPLFLLGEGLNYHQGEFDGEGVVILDEKCNRPSASNVHRCGWLRAQAGLFANADELEPIYLRRPEAEENWERLHGKEHADS